MEYRYCQNRPKCGWSGPWEECVQGDAGGIVVPVCPKCGGRTTGTQDLARQCQTMLKKMDDIDKVLDVN